ncbi:unnamed protein product, partial [Sphacelaria rigidula]
MPSRGGVKLVVAAGLLLVVFSYTASSTTLYKITSDPPGQLQDALDKVGPGDSIELADGDYREEVVTKKSGEPGNYITIRGSSYRAVLKGEEDGSSHIFDLQHSYYHLDRFTIDGYQGDEVYADKCLYVQTNRDR